MNRVASLRVSAIHGVISDLPSRRAHLHPRSRGSCALSPRDELPVGKLKLFVTQGCLTLCPLLLSSNDRCFALVIQYRSRDLCRGDGGAAPRADREVLEGSCLGSRERTAPRPLTSEGISFEKVVQHTAAGVYFDRSRHW